MRYYQRNYSYDKLGNITQVQQPGVFGVDKEIFRQKFKKQALSDILIVSDIEGGNVFKFFFKKDKLIKILYQAEYTD